MMDERFKLTDQDLINIDFASEWLEKAKKKKGNIKGLIKWAGKKGFNECVAHLEGKEGITNAKAVCGALKREARKKGQLAVKHMGRIERAERRKKMAKK